MGFWCSVTVGSNAPWGWLDCWHSTWLCQQAGSEPSSMLAVLLSVSTVLYFPKHFPTHYHTVFFTQSLGGRQSSLLVKKVGVGEMHSARAIAQPLDSKTRGPFHSVQALLYSDTVQPLSASYLLSFIFHSR